MIGRLLAVMGIAVALPVSAAVASQGAPTAITGPVSQVFGSNATATGTVNPTGLSTTYYFEYGTGTGYGSKTASTGAGAGTGNVSVAAALTGLSGGTTYHYRLVASSWSGTAKGSDGIFTTMPLPAVVTGGAADVSPSRAVLTGTVDPNGLPTTFVFEPLPNRRLE